jgi:hypothetical protein
MTTREDFSGGTVDQLLFDAGHSDVPELRAALLTIASLAQMQAPAPGPELAAMLASRRDELTRQRWLRKHRPAVVGLAVLAGMGLGVSGVAATSQASGDGYGPWSVQQLTTGWTPGWTLPLSPSAVDQGGRITWVSPLFLQLDRADAAAAAGSYDAAWPEGTAVEPGAPSTSAREQAQPPGNEGSAGGATPNGNAGGASQNKANAGKAAAGHAMTGRAPDQAAAQAPSQLAEVTPGSVENGAGGSRDEAPAIDGKAATPSVKLGPTVESAIDSTVDSALDSVSSWLGKFRR